MGWAFYDGQVGRVEGPREGGALRYVRLSAVVDPPQGGSIEMTVHQFSENQRLTGLCGTRGIVTVPWCQRLARSNPPQ